ncbi:hypothetical protein [Peribacillus loiseleuriae]|uniref:Uncharacterized protein n=1 Tax=Peribacillus loiseleuriae TaxID=1679170 RepID=A0A0K9GSL1_9BACI|nr:hypothetical protein [Peribacillus loiseleuriae]KMY49628.1 hypothetical protein AC625_08825 [Peribacillus loiseleuriae]
MRFLNSATAAIIMGIILFLTFSTLGAMYDDYVLKSEPGDMELLGCFLEVIIIPPFYYCNINLCILSLLYKTKCAQYPV